ncbi:GerMN domain-containing protein [Embleya sp. MST-111070]|uniref:GerMN domain-containing protein n=1 Tax=Embleya sp. MST-111070 TaxID=3398231 RepID=UPI003F735D5A
MRVRPLRMQVRMRMGTRRGNGVARLRLPFLAAVLLAVGAGCGIPATGAIEAGQPADGIIPPADANHPSGVYVYMVDAHRVVPELRTSSGGDSPQAAIDLLLAGPTREETLTGVSTAIPAGVGPARVTVVEYGTLRVELAGASPLGETALEQVICTAATAGSRNLPGGGSGAVSVITPVQRAENRVCPTSLVGTSGGSGSALPPRRPGSGPETAEQVAPGRLPPVPPVG